MAQDEQGNLKPLMLSELILIAQKSLLEYGDMIVWVETSEAGYEFNEEHSQPVSDPPEVIGGNIAKKKSYWDNENYQNAFVISGS